MTDAFRDIKALNKTYLEMTEGCGCDHSEPKEEKKKEKKKPSVMESLNATCLFTEEELDAILDQLNLSEMSKNVSIDDQMRISRDYNRKSPEEKKKANQAVMGKTPKVTPKKDMRTDAQKMADATDDRLGSFYRRFK